MTIGVVHSTVICLINTDGYTNDNDKKNSLHLDSHNSTTCTNGKNVFKFLQFVSILTISTNFYIFALASTENVGFYNSTFEPPHDKTKKVACAPSEDLDQPEHLPSLISVFAVCMKKAWVLSYPLFAQRKH